MQLIHEFTWRVVADAPLPIGDVDRGALGYHVLPEVVIEGDRLSGTAAVAGSDRFSTTPDGFGWIDVRCPIRTHDDALIDVRYWGWVEPTEVFQQAVERRVPTQFGDQSIRTSWRLMTGDPRYQWVNRALFVGEGRLLPGAGEGQLGMEHRVFRLA